MSYHLLNFQTPLEREEEAHFIVAGDGVYSTMRCFGMSIPVPLVLCEIRGLLPLSSLLFFDEWVLDMPLQASVQNVPPMSFAPSYHVLTEPELPALDASRIYQYVVARQGVFLLAACPAVDVLMPISSAGQLPGLAEVHPFVSWKYPLVSEEIVQELFERARKAVDSEHGHMLEKLFYLTWENEWCIHEPEQVQAATFVKATASSEADEMAPLEGHSHHDMRAYFSGTDNRDELINGGFKVYFVLGCINTQPQIRTRICVHGYSWEVPASTFFALPAGIEDCVASEWGKSR
jgi:PRTRC genetic system protein A